MEILRPGTQDHPERRQTPESTESSSENVPPTPEVTKSVSAPETVSKRLPVTNTQSVPEKIRASVIVNAFNEEAEIGRLLESLKKSWFPGLEIIISDDGSTDRTAEIVKKYIDENPQEKPTDWLKLDKHENLGFGAAKNSGAAFAKGDYLFFFDADAPIPPGMLQEDLQQMDERELDIASHELVAQHKLQKYGTAVKNKLLLI